MNPLKKLAGQTAIYGLSTIIGRLLNYLLIPLYTRIFLPAEFGVFTELYAYVGFFIILFTYGFETAYFRFSEKTKDFETVFSTAFFSILGSTFIFTGALLVMSNDIATWINYPDHSEYVVWFALVLGFDAMTAIPFARLRQKNQPLRFAAIKLVNIMTNIGFNLFFLVLCPWIVNESGNTELATTISKIYSSEVGIGYIFISNLIASTITLILTSSEAFHHKFKFSLVLWKQMMKYSLPLLVVGFAGIINEMIDRILLRQLLPYGDEQNLALIGIYGASYKLSILMTLFVQAYRYAAEPFFFAQSAEAGAKRTYALTMRYFVIAGSVIFLSIMLYIDIAKYFIGPDFRSGLKVVPILLLANLALGIYYNLSIWYKLTDKTSIGAFISVGGATLTIVLNIMLIPTMGYMGSAWATLACYSSMVAASFIIGKKYYPIDYNLFRIMSYIGTAIGVCFLNTWLREWLEIDGTSITYLVSTILLTSYLVMIWYVEKVLK